MIFYSGSRIVCNVFISDIFEMIYAFLCILCILIQGTMVEQLCLNGFTLYKYICNKKLPFLFSLYNVNPHHFPRNIEAVPIT